MSIRGGQACVKPPARSPEKPSVRAGRTAGASFHSARYWPAGGGDGRSAIYILDFLFLGGSEPACEKSADVDDSRTLEITDPIRLLHFLSIGGAPPASPYDDCGLDPTEDDLTCDQYGLCD